MAASVQTIDRLQKKLDKEPNSLIFLQLAEEYRKEGKLDEALNVCREGLRRHPNYWSARVALGRILHQSGNESDARDELEQVIKAVPDNLLANRLLGDIYLETNRTEDALKRYQTVQMLTPADQEISSLISKLENELAAASISVEQQEVEAPATVEEVALPPADVTPVLPPPEESQTVAEVRTANEEMTQTSEQTIEEDEEELVDDEADIITAPILKTPVLTEPVGEMPDEISEPLSPVSDATAEAPSETDLAHIADIFLTSEDAFAEENEDLTPPTGHTIEDLEEDRPMTFATQSSSESIDPRDRTQPLADPKEDIEEAEAEELTTQTLAELYVQQGLLDKAIKVYQKLLLNDPGNRQIMQRLRDLNPVDALIASAVRDDAAPAKEEIHETAPASAVHDTVNSRFKEVDISEERKRKITTLENWLTSIRRERS